MIGDLGLDPRPHLGQSEPRQHRLVAADLHPGRQKIFERVGAGGIGVSVAINVAALAARAIEPVQDLRGLSPIVYARTFQMHDLDMDRKGARHRDRLLDGVEHLVRLVADMGEIGRLVAGDDSA